MPLHLIKLCVGVASVGDLEKSVAACRGGDQGATPAGIVHVTRMVPKKAEEILHGGSLFWVIGGQIAARQVVRDIQPFADAQGIHRCRLVLEPDVIAVLPRPKRAFQGWRYLADDARPPDVGDLDGGGDLPEQLRQDLRELCLL